MRALAAVAGLALAGCVAQPTGVQAQFEAFALTAASADIMSEFCPQYQMRGSLETLTESFVDQMLGLGYSEIEVLEGIQATSEEQLADRVVAEMMRQGVVPGSATSLCAYADREVAAGSPIGRLLR